MTTRHLEKKDAFLIAEFFEQNFSDGWNEKMLESAFSTERFFALGIFDKDMLVAVITYSFLDDSADVEDIVVKKEFRKMGLAKSLLSRAEEHIKENNKKKIFLEVRENNIPAVNLYEGFGYSTINIRKKYYADGENAKVMLKEI